MTSCFQRAVIITIVFLVSIISPFAIEREPVEAHFDSPSSPAMQVEVFLKKIYSTQELDWEWDGKAEVGVNFVIWQSGHTTKTEGQRAVHVSDFNMDSGDWDSDVYENEAGDEFGAYSKSLYVPSKPYRDSFGNPSGLPMVYKHSECHGPTPMNVEIIEAFEDDSATNLQIIGSEAAAVGLGLVLSGGTAAAVAGVIVAVGAIAQGSGADSQGRNYVGPDDPQNTHDISDAEYTMEGEVNQHGNQPQNSVFISWAYLGGSDSASRTIGLEFETKVSLLEDSGETALIDENQETSCGAYAPELEHLDPVNSPLYQPIGTPASSTLPYDNATAQLSDYESDFWLAAADLGMSPVSYPYLIYNYDRGSTIDEAFDFLYDYFTIIQFMPPMIELDYYSEPSNNPYNNESGYGNDTYYPNGSLNNTGDYYNQTHYPNNYSSNESASTEGLREMTADELRLYSELVLEEIVEATINSLMIEAAATIPNYDIYYADSMLYYPRQAIEYRDYKAAVQGYRSSAVTIVEAIENYEPPLSTITIEAIDFDSGELSEEATVVITELGCGDDCTPIYTGEGGSAEVDLPPGEYEMEILDSEGNVIESRVIEAQSGSSSAMVIDVGTASKALDLAFNIQGLLIATLPALVGFAGSRRHLEEKPAERSATPLWIGTVLFIAIFFLTTS